jgi:hypothetical protein
VAVIVLIVIRTIRLIGSDANGVFPYALSSLPGEALPPRAILDQIAPFGLLYKTHISRNWSSTSASTIIKNRNLASGCRVAISSQDEGSVTTQSNWAVLPTKAMEITSCTLTMTHRLSTSSLVS